MMLRPSRLPRRAQALAAALPNWDQEHIPFFGGVDQTTPVWSRKPGRPRIAWNFECDIAGGYRRVKGYERFDGRTSPSDGTYSIIACTFSAAVAAGDTVTGATSAATGVAIAVTASAVILTKVTGTFQSGENLQVSAVTKAVSTSAAIESSAATALLHAQYRNLAADQYRADIAAVPGSGNILGVVRFGGVTYAFRNNVGATAAALYKSTVSGWSAVSLGRKLAFTTGSATVAEGATLTGATSGATAVVRRVAIRAGTVAASTAAGIFVFASVTGAFQNGENLQVAAVTVAVASGADAAITLSPSGRYEFVIHNFGGDTSTKRIYGADGVNLGFEFDGTYFVPIATGMTTDTPTHVWVHKQHLFVSFGASVQHSSTGLPYFWSPVVGTVGEIGMGDTVTGFYSQAGGEQGGALMIFTRNRTSVLYGSDIASWDLVGYKEELGAYAYTIAEVGMHTFILDDRGVTTVQASQAYGNFQHAAISNALQTWINAQRLKAKACCLVRDKSQYRLYFSDRTALYITVGDGNKIIGMLQQELADEVLCIHSTEDSDGSEVIFSGSDDGFVYQHEVGTSFDGDAITWQLFLSFWHLGSPRVEKGFQKAVFEIAGDGYFAFDFRYELAYNSSDIPQGEIVEGTLSLASASWDTGSWDSGQWDAQQLSPVEFDMDGDAENVSLIIGGSSDYMDDAMFSGALIYYTNRGMMH